MYTTLQMESKVRYGLRSAGLPSKNLNHTAGIPSSMLMKVLDKCAGALLSDSNSSTSNPQLTGNQLQSEHVALASKGFIYINSVWS